MVNHRPAPGERPHSRHERGSILIDPSEMDVATKQIRVTLPEGPSKSNMDLKLNHCMPCHRHEPAGPSKYSLRRLCDESANPITSRLTEYERAVIDSDIRLPGIGKAVVHTPRHSRCTRKSSGTPCQNRGTPTDQRRAFEGNLWPLWYPKDTLS